MNDPNVTSSAQALVRRTTRRQELPEKVRDSSVLATVARLLDEGDTDEEAVAVAS